MNQEVAACQGCGRTLDPPKTKWCDDTCRKRAERAAIRVVPIHAVDLNQTLREVEDFITRHVHFAAPEGATFCALWVAHTHAFEAATVTPYLAITSPEKGSGKTRLLEVLELLVREPWMLASISASALFRLVASERVTLLIDETDSIFRERSARADELRGLINAGYRESGKAVRVEGVGRGGKIGKYPVFCPKALAGIGSLPDTIADRSIVIRLERRMQIEWSTRWRTQTASEESEPIRKKLQAWAVDRGVIDQLKASMPDVPKLSSDRAAEVWEPLLAIADLAGGSWPETARQAAAALDAERVQDETQSGTILLLRHIQDIFAKTGREAIPTAELVRGLVDNEEGPWAKWWGRGLSMGDVKGPAASLAKMLSHHHIRPREIATTLADGQPQMGYYRSDFEQAWRRYLPSAEDTKSPRVSIL